MLLLIAIYYGNQFQVMGITGGIATGKSTVSGMLESAGFTIIGNIQNYLHKKEVKFSLWLI